MVGFVFNGLCAVLCFGCFMLCRGLSSGFGHSLVRSRNVVVVVLRDLLVVVIGSMIRFELAKSLLCFDGFGLELLWS